LHPAFIGGRLFNFHLIMSMQNFEIRVNEKTFVYSHSQITGRELLKLIGLRNSSDYEILLKLSKDELEPVEIDENVDLTNPEIETFFIKPYPSVTITVDDEELPIAQIFMTPKEVLTLAGLDESKFYLKQLIEHQEITYKNDADHVLAMHDKMKFTSCKIASTTVS
jgi:hypothetical protein